MPLIPTGRAEVLIPHRFAWRQKIPMLLVMGMGFPRNHPPWADDSYQRSGMATGPIGRSMPPLMGGRMSFTSCLVVVLGGAMGTFLRYGVSVLALPISRDLPWGTIMINITGSFVIGLFGTLTLASGRFPASENLRLFVMIGLCGGYTTFSSFSLQTLDLLRAGAMARAALNIGLSVMLCIAAVAVGHFIAARVNGNDQRIAQISIEEEG